MKQNVDDYLNNFNSILKRTEYRVNNKTREADYFFNDLFLNLQKISNKGNRIFFVGNGASNAMASHFAADFTKNGEISSTAFTDGSLLTCYSNDYSFEEAFREILNRQYREGDGLIAISSSGNSMNVVNACSFIHTNYPESLVLTLSGFKPDNKLRSVCSHNVYVPGATYGIVESAHSYLLHLIIDLYIEEKGKKNE